MVTKMHKAMTKKLHTVSKMEYEVAAWQDNKFVCGVDEVGRGCLAGPVVAAAVIFPVGAVIDGVRDSKLILPKELSFLAKQIHKAAWIGFGIINPYLIDNCNIRQATLLAMCRAVENLFAICPAFPEKILIDDMSLDKYLQRKISCVSAPKGELWSYSIAAASIVAKVKRDQLMAEYNKIFADMYFDKHKGYGTNDHYNSLARQGKTILHRNSFLRSFGSNKDKESQCVLF